MASFLIRKTNITSSSEPPRNRSILVRDDPWPLTPAKQSSKKKPVKPCLPQSKTPQTRSYTRTHSPFDQQSRPTLLPPTFLPSNLPHSSIHFTHSHSPLKFSFHKLTRLSPPLTASTFPLRLQLTRHKTVSKFKTMLVHSLLDGSDDADVQIRTVLSCDAEAMYDFCRIVGAQATSRTQSVCPGRERVGV